MANKVDDPARLAVLARTGLLDSPPEERFDTITKQVVELLGAPLALLSIVDAERQFFKSAVGLEEPWKSKRESPLAQSFCRYVVEHGQPLVVEDAATHPIVRESPAIEHGVVSYLGVPVEVDGEIIGSLCAVDGCRRDWKQTDIAALKELAAKASSEIKTR